MWDRQIGDRQNHSIDDVVSVASLSSFEQAMIARAEALFNMGQVILILATILILIPHQSCKISDIWQMYL